MQAMDTELGKSDLETVRSAIDALENVSLPIRFANLLGRPIESLQEKIRDVAPERLAEITDEASRRALELVFEGAVKSLDSRHSDTARPYAHTIAATASGTIGGFFGLPGLVVELPVTTGIIFRSIADIARSEAAALNDSDTMLRCIEVFAYGSKRAASDDAADTGYYGTRVLLGRATAEASSYLMKAGVSNAASAPAIVRLIATLASRFGIVVNQKVALQLVPVVGAVGGGLINSIFISHYQDVARAHFSLARLERKYGIEPVMATYDRLKTAAE